MDTDYYIYLGDNGWWGNNGQATSELKRAKTFTRQEAIDFCKRRYDKRNEMMSAVPVNSADLNEVMR